MFSVEYIYIVFCEEAHGCENEYQTDLKNELWENNRFLLIIIYVVSYTYYLRTWSIYN